MSDLTAPHNLTTDEFPSICFVIPYFGRWPFWIPFFLESCRANPTIDWLFFSDCGRPDDCPPNVKVIDMTYSDYCEYASSRLGVHFAPFDPYKLCDLKPALGLVHERELTDYDFWAFGDIDVVYGDLRKHFTNERLASKDLFSSHARRVSGHCCVIRNSERMREAFMLVKDWDLTLANPKHFAFDEKGFSHLFLRHKNWPRWLAKIASNLDRLQRSAEFYETFSTPYARVAWHDGSHRFPATWIWRNGRLTNDLDGSREFPYFHFLVWKSREWKNLHHDPDLIAHLAKQMNWKVSAQGFSSTVC